jgi:hypothetical protein
VEASRLPPVTFSSIAASKESTWQLPSRDDKERWIAGGEVHASAVCQKLEVASTWCDIDTLADLQAAENLLAAEPECEVA